jgi:hypothetical protein
MDKEYDSNESTKSEEEVEELTMMVRRSERIRKPINRYIPPDFYSVFMLTTIGNEPMLVGEQVDSIEGKLWKGSMVEETESLYNNETWDLVKLPSGRNHVSSRWVFKKKMNAHEDKSRS